MTDSPSAGHNGRRGILTVLAAAAVVAGLVVLGIAVAGQQSAPSPPPSASRPAPTPVSPEPSSPGATSPSPADGKNDERSGAGDRTERPLQASPPVSITIPAIDVRSEVFPIGKAPDGTLRVPSGARVDQTAWFENSPTPGQPGPSVIEGHVDTEQGPSVFFRLGDLRPGDEVHVTREDGVRVTFTVRRLKSYPKDRFPTELVYGGNLGTPTLRLITCDEFDPAEGTHTANLIAFAELTDVRRA